MYVVEFNRTVLVILLCLTQQEINLEFLEQFEPISWKKGLLLWTHSFQQHYKVTIKIITQWMPHWTKGACLLFC